VSSRNGEHSRQRQRGELTAKLEHLDGLRKAAATFDVKRFRRLVVTIAGQLETMLYHPAVKPEDARELLRALFASPVELSPRFDDAGAFAGWEWSVLAAHDHLLLGIVGDGWDGEPQVRDKAATTMVVPPG
jgi:hypothetical protein